MRAEREDDATLALSLPAWEEEEERTEAPRWECVLCWLFCERCETTDSYPSRSSWLWRLWALCEALIVEELCTLLGARVFSSW